MDFELLALDTYKPSKWIGSKQPASKTAGVKTANLMEMAHLIMYQKGPLLKHYKNKTVIVLGIHHKIEPETLMNYFEIYLVTQSLLKIQTLSAIKHKDLNLTGISKLLIQHDLTLSLTTNFRLFQTERVCRRQFQV